jgi:glycosyltransferase involved in cell wall biosynthesis
MNLLIVTQAVDKADPVLGFFHRWIEEIAKHCTHVTVIAQRMGEHHLPANVTVLSMEKERGKGRFAQVARFWKLIWIYRSGYDRALVHMTPIWNVLGTPIWSMLRKPQYLWYESRGNRWPLRLALRWIRKVFSASAHGLPFEHKKQVITGHGIDTDRFSPGTEAREKGLLVSAGRITRSKRIGLLIESMAKLPSDYRLVLAGAPITEADRIEDRDMKELAHRLKIADRITFGALPQAELPALLRRADLFLHASVTSLDKAVLEAMACGCLVVSTARALASVLPPECVSTDEKIADRAFSLCTLPEDERKALRDRLRSIVVEGHSLQTLAKRLVFEMSL